MKFNGKIEDRVDLLKIFMILLIGFSSFALVYRKFFSKSLNYNPIVLHSIYDRNKNIMAYNVTTYQLSIQPDEITYPLQLLDKLNHLDIDPNAFLKNIYAKEKFILAKNLQLEDVQGIKHPGLYITKFSKREYPLGKNFTTIGVCDLQKGIIKGVENLAKKEVVDLTIDIRVQNIIANILEKGKKEHGAELCFGIVLNMDGEILAVHTTNCTDTDNIKDYFNNVFFGLFEYGSTCKVFTMLAGLFFKDFNIDTVFDTDEGKTIFGRVINDYEPIPRFSNIFVILSKSSNRGTTAASRKIGRKLVDFFKLLKLDEPVDLGFTKTAKPFFFKKYKDDEILGMGFGYNFMTNAFNIIRAFLIIFTNGKIINPTILLNDKRRRVIGKLETNVFNDIIEVMKFTAKRHPTLDKLGCASKTGTVDRIVSGKYDSHRVNTYIVCAVPGLNGKFQYLMLLGMIDPAEYKRAGWNIREMAAEIAERIFSL